MIVELNRDDVIRILTSLSGAVSYDHITRYGDLVSIDGWGRTWWKTKEFHKYTTEYLWQLYCEISGKTADVIKKSEGM